MLLEPLHLNFCLQIQTNNILMEAHFPGSTPIDEESLLVTCPEQVTKGEVSEHKTVIDYDLND